MQTLFLELDAGLTYLWEDGPRANVATYPAVVGVRVPDQTPTDTCIAAGMFVSGHMHKQYEHLV